MDPLFASSYPPQKKFLSNLSVVPPQAIMLQRYVIYPSLSTFYISLFTCKISSLGCIIWYSSITIGMIHVIFI